MANASATLATVATRNQVYLERLKSHEVQKFDRFLRDMDQVVRGKLDGENLTDFGRGRLEALLSEIDAQLAAIQSRYWRQLKLNLQDVAEYQGGLENRALIKATDGTFDSVLPTQTQLITAALTNPLSLRGAGGGKVLESFVSDWSRSERQAFTGLIRRGYAEGMTNGRIVQTIRGTRAARYTDGLLDMTRRHADAVVRTAVQGAASAARAEVWKANSDLVTGYQWIATLDQRTCAICRPMDGEKFKVGAGPLPPIHPQCRCATAPTLAAQFDVFNRGATRASMHGPVPQSETYYTWLKQQPAEFQDSVLGPKRGRLFRDGGLSADRFAALQLDRKFHPLTLAEMKALEPLAFLRAGLD